jgi:hypothetical protein
MPPPPEDRGDFFSGNDVTADPFSAAEPMDPTEPEPGPRGRRPGQGHPPEPSPDELRSFLSPEGPSLPALRERMGLPPLPEQGDDAGNDAATAESFTEEAPQGDGDFAAGDAGDGGFFTAESDPFDVPVMAGIERDAHQQRRDAIYDELDYVAGGMSAVGSLVSTVNDPAGRAIGGAGGALWLANRAGRGLGNALDAEADYKDALLHKKTQQDIQHMKNEKAREKINKTTPRGHNKVTED